jgi:hypothetical protein
MEQFISVSTVAPSLLAMAGIYKANPGGGLPQIYNAETCEEVHQLLLLLLRGYERSLRTINNLQKSAVPPKKAAKYEVAILTASTCATALRALLYSSFIGEHLHRIRPPHPRTIQVPLSPAGAAGDGLDDEDEDSELMDIMPSVEIHMGSDEDEEAVVHSYLAFLRLQVSPFEAGDNLIGACSRVIGNREIIISTVAAEFPPQTVRNWEEVVKEVMAVSIPNAFPSSVTEGQAIEVIKWILAAFGTSGKLKFS